MMKERKVRRTRKFVGAIGVMVTVASLSGCVSNGTKSDNTNKEVSKIEATKSKNDFNAYKKWVNMTYEFNEQCNGILNTIIRKNGYNDTILLVNIVNDLNKDAVLFSSVNGKTAYDFVQGIDITKQN